MTDFEALLEQELTPEQKEVVLDDSNEILCLACAGSGKSKTLAYRVAKLIVQGESPESIVVFTFTEKAAESIKFKIAKVLEKAGKNPDIIGVMYIGTIHSYCQYLLSEMDSKYRQFDVLDENKFTLYLISRYNRLGIESIRSQYSTALKKFPYFKTIENIANAWSTLNDESLSLEEIRSFDNVLSTVLNNIKISLDRDQYIDFSSMIRLVVDGLIENRREAERAVSSLKHLLVDEYQDVNPLQEKLIKQLHQRSESLLVVGDDDQSIYAWRGADVTNILTFQERYPSCTPHTLSTNFRSTPLIVNSADSFIHDELGATRYVKNPRAQFNRIPQDFGTFWFHDKTEEAEWVASRIQALMGTKYIETDGTIRGLTPADFAILMRSTRGDEQDGTSRHTAFTEALISRNIPFSLEAGGSIFGRVEVAILRDSFELLRNGTPNRIVAQDFFNHRVLPFYPNADFTQFAQVLAEWGRKIHSPLGDTRRRVYPQELVHELLSAFRLQTANFDDGIMQDIGAFSRMLQDVESVYMSVDSAFRFTEILNFMQNAAESGYLSSTDLVLRRPDVVTVTTVHKMKGLEFPTVFVVDVEARRFPGDNEGYKGWLPRQIIQPAITRNAYINTREGEARLFYTAMTRAETYLYISGSEHLPGGKNRRKPSQFTQRLNSTEINRVHTTLLANLEAHTQIRRIDETVIPTSFSDIRYYLKCPKDYQFRKSFGFSPPIVEMFGFGQTVHASICKLHELFTVPPDNNQIENTIENMFHLKHVPQSKDPINNPGPYERAKESVHTMAQNYVSHYSDDFIRRKQVEVRFEVPLRQAVISGVIDLMLHEDESGKILDTMVVDFKSVQGGEEPAAREDLHWTEMSLQVQLYAKAANDILGQNAKTGAVHLLKDNQRIEIPVNKEAIDAAVNNIEWAVDKIIQGDFPMRSERSKCEKCDFNKICSQRPENFQDNRIPTEIHLPENRKQLALAFSEFNQ
jgi:DNA helicase-2/ATP-dependent DNA helicase PcrA